jgi:hypothetical protein
MASVISVLNIKHLKSDLLFKNKDDQFRTGAVRKQDG